MHDATTTARQRLRCGTEGQERRDGLEAAAAAALLCTPDQERFEPAAPPHDQRARARGAAELVRADAHQVCVERAEIGRHVPRGGRRVDVDGHAGLAAKRDHLVDGLERAHLVIGPLAVDERRTGKRGRLEPRAQGLDIDPPRSVDRQHLDRGHTGGGVTDGRVLDGRAEHGRTGCGAAGAPHGGVDRLGRAGREDDLARDGSE